MTSRSNVSFVKRLGLVSLWAGIALACIYITFIGIVSVWVGLSHSHEEGFWLPVFTGGIAILLTLFFFFHFTRSLVNRFRMKTDESHLPSYYSG
jgi:hypothetical protein